MEICGKATGGGGEELADVHCEAPDYKSIGKSGFLI